MTVSADAGQSAQGGAEGAAEKLLIAPLAILEALPDAVVAAGRDRRIVFVNDVAEELFGYSRAELVGQPVENLWPERVRERYVRNLELYFETDHHLRFSSEVRGMRRDGSEFLGEMSWGIVGTSDGPLLLAVGRDITERRASEARSRAVAVLGERALAGADPRGLASEALELLTSTLPITSGQLWLGDGGVLATVGPATPGDMRLPIGTRDKLVMSTQRELTDEELAAVHAVANILTTALARLRDEARMRHDAVHDPLTGLANRVLLRDRLETALARSERGGSETGVFFVDLDNFKRVNDVYGHATGDAVLVELGERLRGALRPTDTVARMGGDEFVAICEGVDEKAALALGRRIQDAIRPLSASGAHDGLSASIGIALGHGNPDVLLAHADVAVYRAKAEGRGRVALFESV
jgi:diguanylate cyclase (GGDEF)-like protein/PAS domain S-box-containing protein